MKFFSCLAAIALAFGLSQTAEAANLLFRGQIHLDTPASPPLANARVTVTFHGHENGIQEYEVSRTVGAVTDIQGRFDVRVKLAEYRYLWTYTTIQVEATDVSKEAAVIGSCQNNDLGGCTGVKQFEVNPLNPTLQEAVVDAAKP